MGSTADFVNTIAVGRRFAPLNVGEPSPVGTTMIYTHVLNRGGRGVQSPVDRLGLGLEGRLGMPE